MRRFCVNCGVKESEDVPIIDSLCIKCYIAIKEVIRIPNIIEIPTCSKCGALFINGKWCYPALADEAKEIIEKYVISMVKPSEDVTVLSVNANIVPPSYREAKIFAVLLIKNKHNYILESKVNIVWIKKLCPICFQRVGKSFDAVVQIRFIHVDESAEKFRKDVMRLFQDYVIEIEEVDKGYNIKVSSQSIARKIADLAKKNWKMVRIVESFGDIKKSRDGTRRARLYISIRIVNPKVGDYIVLEGKAYTITKVDNEGVTVVDSNGSKRPISFNELQSLYEKSRARSGHRSVG